MGPPTGYDAWGAPGAPVATQSFASLPPSQPPAATDPWGSSITTYNAPPPVAAASGFGGYTAPPPTQDPFGAPASANGYGYNAPPPPTQDPFGAPPPAANGYGYGAPPAPAQDPFGSALPPQAPAPASAFGAPPASDPFAAPAKAYGAPPMQQPPQQQPPSGMYGQPPPTQQQPPFDPFGTPAPQTVSTGYDYTPVSTIGFSSPVAQNNSAPPEPVPMSAPIVEPAVQQQQQWNDPALFSMGTLSTTTAPNNTTAYKQSQPTSGSMVDQAYAKLVNMDAFDLVKDKSEQKNPFDFGVSSIGSNTASLADMKKGKSVSILYHMAWSFCLGSMCYSSNSHLPFPLYHD